MGWKNASNIWTTFSSGKSAKSTRSSGSRPLAATRRKLTLTFPYHRFSYRWAPRRAYLVGTWWSLLALAPHYLSSLRYSIDRGPRACIRTTADVGPSRLFPPAISQSRLFPASSLAAPPPPSCPLSPWAPRRGRPPA